MLRSFCPIENIDYDPVLMDRIYTSDADYSATRQVFSPVDVLL